MCCSYRGLQERRVTSGGRWRRWKAQVRPSEGPAAVWLCCPPEHCVGRRLSGLVGLCLLRSWQLRLVSKERRETALSYNTRQPALLQASPPDKHSKGTVVKLLLIHVTNWLPATARPLLSRGHTPNTLKSLHPFPIGRLSRKYSPPLRWMADAPPNGRSRMSGGPIRCPRGSRWVDEWLEWLMAWLIDVYWSFKGRGEWFQGSWALYYVFEVLRLA